MGLFKKHSRRRALPLRRGLCNRGDATAFQMFGYSTIVYVFTDWIIQASINDPRSTAQCRRRWRPGAHADRFAFA